MEDSMEYGKKSVGQWVMIYLVLGLVVYGAIYYFAMGKKDGGYSYGNKPTESITPDPSELATKTSIYLTDADGMSLYTFDEDTTGVSNCYDKCATNWPPYLVGDTTVEGLTIISRKDGSKQYAKDGMPLYYYKDDAKAGDIMGDGVNGTWLNSKDMRIVKCKESLCL